MYLWHLLIVAALNQLLLVSAALTGGKHYHLAAVLLSNAKMMRLCRAGVLLYCSQVRTGAETCAAANTTTQPGSSSAPSAAAGASQQRLGKACLWCGASGKRLKCCSGCKYNRMLIISTCFGQDAAKPAYMQRSIHNVRAPKKKTWGSLAMWKRMPTAVLAKPPCCMQRGPEKGACIKVTLQNHQALASLLVKEPSLN
eukprot:scaffold96633_cov18-Tisochrysis_lutea.AAC.1